MNSGIYKIVNNETGVFYLGSSKNLSYRWWKHRNHLKRHVHCNPYLQNIWNKYGGQIFSFIIVEQVDSTLLIEREQYWLDKIKLNKIETYNLTFTAGGGDTISNHPNRANILKKMSDAQKGEMNGMFGRNHSEATRLKWSILRKGQNAGEKHPQYGMRLSEETRKKISNSRSKKVWRFLSPSNDVIEIRNLSEFCRIHNLHKSAMGNVFSGKATHHKQWRALNAISMS